MLATAITAAMTTSRMSSVRRSLDRRLIESSEFFCRVVILWVISVSLELVSFCCVERLEIAEVTLSSWVFTVLS